MFTDHHIIEFSIRTKFTKAKPVRRVIFDYNKTDFSALRRALSEAELDVPFTNNMDECWKQWKSAFLSIVTNFVPTKPVPDTNSPPWIDGEVRHLIRKKYTALRHCRKNKTSTRKIKLRTFVKKSSTQSEVNMKCTLLRSKYRLKTTPRCSGATIKLYFITDPR